MGSWLHRLIIYYIGIISAKSYSLYCHSGSNLTLFKYVRYIKKVDPGGPVVIILASGTEVHGFHPGRCRWILSERKNPEYDFLRKGSKALGPVS